MWGYKWCKNKLSVHKVAYNQERGADFHKQQRSKPMSSSTLITHSFVKWIFALLIRLYPTHSILISLFSLLNLEQY